MKILITGGSGLLGKHLISLLKKQDGDGHMFPRLEIDSPSSEELDITKGVTPKNYDLIIHCAAYTDVAKAEIEKQKCFEINTIGTLHLAEAYQDTPFVYLSTEYAYNPINHYAITKYFGELIVEKVASKHLIIRTLFKPNPFPYVKAFTDQYTQGDYVDIIAPLIATKILDWIGKESELVYVGTGRKTIFDLAQRTNPDVRGGSVDDIAGVRLPKDYQ